MRTGQCECGAVRFQASEVRDTITACHCSQCRRSSGHVWASTVAPLDQVRFEADDGLTWYRSSDFAKRGFCNQCGSSLFYMMDAQPNVLAIASGCLDDTSDMVLTKHIFTKDKGGYYDIKDDAEKLETY